MSGIKGRSGGLSGQEHAQRAEVIALAWANGKKICNGIELKPQTAALAQAIIAKTIPTTLEGEIGLMHLNVLKYARDN